MLNIKKSFQIKKVSMDLIYLHIYNNKTLNQSNMAASKGRFQKHIKIYIAGAHAPLQ